MHRHFFRALKPHFGRKEKVPPPVKLAPELSAFDCGTIALAQQYSMTSVQRLQALTLATRYIAKGKIPGAIIECGVWRGGSMLAVARTLIDCNDANRHLYLFDTYEGMPQPGALDVRQIDGVKAADFMNDPNEDHCIASLETVKQTMGLSNYDPNLVNYVVGRVEETIPKQAPQSIALLRLDTDWYASTRHELEHLFPRLAPGGVLIIDDYGWWDGARRAVDEYFKDSEKPILLNVIDETGRIGIRI
jgi:O-methyltransferase